MNTIITIRSKAIVLLSAFAIVSSSAFSQSKDRNYQMEKVALDAEGKNYLKSVQYYNGLGYPTVSVGVVGGSGQTAYTLTTYDGVGREDCKYLPVSTDYSILYKAPSTIQANSKSSNGYNDTKAFSQTTYDALDRPLKVTTAGTAFANNPSKITYSANAGNVVKRYEVSGDKLVQNSSSPFYLANSLTNEISTDPDGVKVETFKDFSGKVIMQRVNGNLCTYYVYDNLGLLRFVLPPKCTSADKDLVAAYGYRYRYDKRGRLITKTLPGCDSIKYWYDSRDRMICMRDPRLRAAGKYRFFIYDKFNRLVVQGVCTSCPTNATVRNAAFSSSENGVLGTSYVMPSDYVTALKNPQLELANYYDKNHNNIKGDKSAYFADIKNVTTSRSQLGLLTGTIAAASNGDFMAQVMVYDVKGNITNVKSRELGGKIVSNTNKYSHTGNLQSSTVSANVKYGSALKIEEKIGYNKYNNKKNADTITINHGTAATSIMSYTYNKLGQIATITRPLPSSVTRTVSYAYDMHGWLKTIKTNSFMEELFYADCPDKAYNRYNGNIGSMRWKDKTSSAKRGYKFTYDKANRMTAGVYGEGDNLTSNPNLFTESMTYDENGNVKTVKRYNKGSSGTSVLMDNLTITYNGNQPSSVAETVADNNTEGSFEYKKAKGSGYKFNTSGSLLADKSRGIAYITYDLNNNPEKIYFTNGSMTKYIYSASGQKLRAIHYTAKPNITKAWGSKPADLTAAQTLSVDSTDYLLGGSLVMTNGKIDKYLFEGGYAQATSTSKSADSFAFNYYNQDHLGNNREVVDAKGVVQQVTNYYPFGAPYADATASKGADVQPYKYNGKELDLMHGLNTYDYGARQHDPILARWDRIDPLCEKYYDVSPYAYCNNNPVNLIDPNGMKWEDQKEADKLNERISKRISKIEKGVGKAQDKITKGGLSDKKMAKLENQIKEGKQRIDNLKQSMNDIKQLGDDQNTTYAFRQIGGGEHHVRQGDNGTVYIETSSDAMSIHEITHIRQSLDAGGLKFSNGLLNNAGKKLESMCNMEVEAYKMQYSYDRSFPGRTNGLNGIDVHSVGNITNEHGAPVYGFIHTYSVDIRKQEKLQRKILGR